MKLALITGGTSGIGFGVARKLAPDYDLALSFASNEEKAQAAAESLKKEFPETAIHTFPQILKNHEDCKNLYQAVIQKFQKTPSILVNSAGRLSDGLFLQADFEKFKSVIDEHLVSTMALSQLALKAMYKERWGRVINMSSISANFSKRGQANYAAAKAGIEAFTRTLALEVAHRGVTINAIAPGLIQTPMTEDLIARIASEENSLQRRIPVGRLGQPEEVGALAAYLCSKNAEYITGTVIVIDGGRSLGDSSS